MRQEKLVISPVVTPSTPSTTPSAQGASTSLDAGKISKSLVTIDDQETDKGEPVKGNDPMVMTCLLYTSPSPRDRQKSRMPSSA